MKPTLEQRAAHLPFIKTTPGMFNQAYGFHPSGTAKTMMEIGASFVPGVGEAMDIRDFAEGYEKGDKLQMGLAGVGLGLPFVSGLGGMVKAYHGSPHVFDAFDSSRIGTGEGAQAYGHGMYFAENPDVAGEYKNALATTITVDGKPILRNNSRVGTTGNQPIDDWLVAYDGDVDKAIRESQSDIDFMLSEGRTPDRQVYEELDELKSLRDRVKVENSGSVYDVELDVEAADLLDWDAPLSQQSEKVREALDLIGEDLPRDYDVLRAEHADLLDHLRVLEERGAPLADRAKVGDLMDRLASQMNAKPMTGKDLYKKMQQNARDEAIEAGNNALATLGGSQSAASSILRQAGLPGLLYLDAGSRAAEKGTRNIVMFPGSEDLIKITGRK